MFLRPNQAWDYFLGSGPAMGQIQGRWASPMHMKPLLHIYVVPQQHSVSASSSFFLIYHSPSTSMFQIVDFNIHACRVFERGGQNMLTSSEGRLHTVASLTSCCRTLHREGELLRESNSAVREESCLHCCRRRCGRGARLQKGRKGGDPISRQS